MKGQCSQGAGGRVVGLFLVAARSGEHRQVRRREKNDPDDAHGGLRCCAHEPRDYCARDPERTGADCATYRLNACVSRSITASMGDRRQM